MHLTFEIDKDSTDKDSILDSAVGSERREWQTFSKFQFNLEVQSFSKSEEQVLMSKAQNPTVCFIRHRRWSPCTLKLENHQIRKMLSGNNCVWLPLGWEWRDRYVKAHQQNLGLSLKWLPSNLVKGEHTIQRSLEVEPQLWIPLNVIYQENPVGKWDLPWTRGLDQLASSWMLWVHLLQCLWARWQPSAESSSRRRPGCEFWKPALLTWREGIATSCPIYCREKELITLYSCYTKRGWSRWEIKCLLSVDGVPFPLPTFGGVESRLLCFKEEATLGMAPAQKLPKGASWSCHLAESRWPSFFLLPHSSPENIPSGTHFSKMSRPRFWFWEIWL